MVLGFPLCFGNKKRYTDWKSLTKEAPVIGHCWDCTPAYAAEMRHRGLCMHPETVFIPVTEWADVDLIEGPPDVFIAGVPPLVTVERPD